MLNLIALSSTLILARLLLPEDFGLVAIAGSVAAVVISITELSLAQALVQHKKPAKHHYDTAWTLNILRATGLAMIISALAYPTAAIYGDPRLIPLLLVIGGTTIISGAENPKIINFYRDLIFWQDFVLNVASKLAGFVVAVALALAFRTYWALVIGSVAAELVRVIASYVVLPYFPRFSLRGSRELLSFSMWLTLSNTIKTINGQSDTLAVGLLINQTSVGHYVMGGRLAFLPVREGLAPVRKILFPAFSRMQGNLPRLQMAYLKAQGLICMLAFPVGLGLALVADPLVVMLIGEKWSAAVPIVQILAFISAFQVIESSQQLAMSLGKTNRIFSRDLRVLVIRFPLMIAGLALGQATALGPILGLIYGRAAASLINVLLNLQLVREIADLPIRAQLAPALRPALAASIMAAALMVASVVLKPGEAPGGEYLRLALLLFLSVFSYVASLAVAWWGAGRPEGAEREIIRILRSILGNLARTRR